ncbi:MAG TPA: family 16 glycoside hydrolase [Chthoniobacter sp.]|jgi:serine/threonine protein kinase
MNLEGQQLGEFEILERLGQGGMGAVYKARQTSLDRLVALKTLQSALAEDAEYIGRFRQEAMAAAGLNHPNLVQVISAGETGGLHWFAMEYVEGESARGRLKRKGRLDPLEAIAIAIHVATALEYGWQKARLIHRDIKPDNIFLSGDGEVKLGDLGLAKSIDNNQELTKTGHAMGSPYYISPEQVQAMKDVDLRADIYSLGCTLFHLLSGKAPFEGNSAVAIMMKHVHEPAPDLHAVWPECPRGLAKTVGKMMRKVPEQRPPNYAEVIADLGRAYDVLNRAGTPYRSIAKGRSEKKQRTVPRAAMVLAAVAACMGVGVLLYFAPWKKGGHHPEPERAEKKLTAQKNAPGIRETGEKTAAVPAEGRALAVAMTPAPEATPSPTPPPPTVATSVPTPPASKSTPSTPPRSATPKPQTEVEKWLAEVDGPQQEDFQRQALKPFEAGVADLRVRYVAALDAAVAKASTAGQLADALVWRTERQAFEKAQNVAADDDDTPPGVKTLRESFRQQLARLNQERIAQAKALLAKYDAVLAKNQILLTQRRRLDDALLLKTKRDEVALAWLAPPALITIDAVDRPEPAQPIQTTATLGATKEAAFVNTLGMKFVPVPIVGGPNAGRTVLFSVWDTRVQDYAVYAQEKGIAPEKPIFEQGPTHPVVNVSWEDAKAFCAWLSQKEGRTYRLPSDYEWSCAVGVGEREFATKLPSEKDGMIGDAFPWGTQWPPPKGAGNYAGEEARPALLAKEFIYLRDVIAGYNDGFVNTSPVGSFAANRMGLFDMGGNVQQWCEDWFDGNRREHLARGSAWNHDKRETLLSSHRFHIGPNYRGLGQGFRCVLAITSEKPPTLTADGFRPLFDGRTLANWRALDRDVEPENWRVTEGALTGTPPSYLMTREEFGDFDLRLEWRVGSGGNGGIMYRIVEDGLNIPLIGTKPSAVEFQLADDRLATKRVWLSGAAWGVLAPTEKASHPPGEWNTARLVVQGGSVEHWINDRLVCRYDLADPATRAAFLTANVNADFSETKRSHVALQSFGGEVYYRNLRIRETGGTLAPPHSPGPLNARPVSGAAR